MTDLFQNRLTDFYYPNPDIILALCYGLLVYPLEFWKKQAQINYKLLEKQIIEEAHNLALPNIHCMQDLFESIESKGKDVTDTASLIKSLRNAISHSHVQLNPEQNKFTFWDINPKSGEKHFEADITLINLSLSYTRI